jgi:pyruvate dehydrogenase E1 component beta subunit
MPSTPYDAKGLFFAALNDGNPVMMIEHRWTFETAGYVPEEIYEVPIGKGLVRRSGADVSVVAVSQMVFEAMKAANMLEREGIDVEVVEPRTLKPLDEDIILESVARTGRLVVADVACRMGSIAAEITCRICERDPGLLKAPVKRVCFPDTPTPCSPPLEEAYYPAADGIVAAVKEILTRRAHV